MRAGLFEVGLAFGVDERGGAVGEHAGRIGRGAVALRLDENGPARTETPERVVEPAGDGDQLIIDFVGRVDGVEFEGGKAENTPLVIGSGQFIPGFEEQLTGVKTGDEKTFTVTFPED